MTLHKFVYQYEGNTFLGERYPQHEVVIQSKCDDLNADEILQLFKSYMLSCGYAEKSFYDACTQAAEENPYREERSYRRNRYEVGETQWREEISPTYQTTFRHAKDNIPVKDTNPIKDMLS
jgi:hypothetical protein